MTALLCAAFVVVGAGLLIVATWRRSSWLVGWGLLSLGLSYSVWLVHGAGRDVALAAPLAAAGLVAVGEAAFHGVERSHGTEYGGRQLAWLAIISMAAFLVCAFVLLAATISARRSLVLTVVGALAAAIAIALPSVRFGRPRRR